MAIETRRKASAKANKPAPKEDAPKEDAPKKPASKKSKKSIEESRVDDAPPASNRTLRSKGRANCKEGNNTTKKAAAAELPDDALKGVEDPEEEEPGEEGEGNDGAVQKDPSDSESEEDSNDEDSDDEDGEKKQKAVGKGSKKCPPKRAGRPAQGLYDTSCLSKSYLPQLVQVVDQGEVKLLLGVHPETMHKGSVHELPVLCTVCGQRGALTSMSKHKCPKWTVRKPKVTTKQLVRTTAKKLENKDGRK
jgi:hypothetical protein